MSAILHHLDTHLLHSRHPLRRLAGLAIAVAGTVILAAHGAAALLDALESSGMAGASWAAWPGPPPLPPVPWPCSFSANSAAAGKTS
ncbi:MAG: hypothetical protein QM756_23825 [Polyangiaceae bacterium]